MHQLLKKMNVIENSCVLILNPVHELTLLYTELKRFVHLDFDVIRDRYDVIIAFVYSEEDIHKYMDIAMHHLDANAQLWFSYPKKSSKKFKATIDRDLGWNILGSFGYEPVRQIALDDDFSMLRFKHISTIKSLSRNPEMALSDEGKHQTIYYQKQYQLVEDEMKRLIFTHSKEQAIIYALKGMLSLCQTFQIEIQDDTLKIAYGKASDYQHQENYSISDIRKEALKCHEYARSQTDLSTIYLARMIGQGISTIHVKTHATGVIYYGYKLLKALGFDQVRILDHMKQHIQLFNESLI